jgi:hypothetical protein
MSQPQPRELERRFHVSINGCRVEPRQWAQRRVDAADLVRRRLLTLREASEHFGLPEEEILGVAH